MKNQLKMTSNQMVMFCSAIIVLFVVCDATFLPPFHHPIKIPPQHPGSHRCGPCEEYKSCGTACPRTCANKDIKINCKEGCKEGCFCKEGFVRDEKTGQCIDPKHCPKEICTGINEKLVPCAKPAWCNTCRIRGNCKLTSCTKGCDCKPGYFRNENGVCCIPEEQCPENCKGINEEYQSCGTACPMKCSDIGKEPLPCTAQCVPGCFCKKGFIRNDKNVCVQLNQCPKHECCEEEHQIYKKWNTACEKTCSNMDQDIKCTKECKEGCFCADGYVRNDDWECVLPEECPECEE